MKLLNIFKKESFTVFESIYLILIFLILLSVFSIFSSYAVLGNFFVLIGTLAGNLLITGVLACLFSFLFFYLKKRNQKSFKDYNIEVFIAIWVLCAFIDIGLRNYYYAKLGIIGESYFVIMEQWFMAPLVFLFFFFNLAKRQFYPEVK
jgi:hypothetical protein